MRMVRVVGVMHAFGFIGELFIWDLHNFFFFFLNTSFIQ
jgi:hypothetical protein